MGNIVRIGTRSSQLAIWQANQVKQKLQQLGIAAELVVIDGHGDQDLTKPLHQLGTVGLFTKNLDDAMLAGKIDLAVHSLKDVPTELPAGIVQAAVLERGPHLDVLVHKGDVSFLESQTTEATIATGSLRRKAQWLARHPHHNVVPLRGNVNTRLQKLKNNPWQGAIFAQAGLQRIGLLPKNHLSLDWMMPAPAQGIIMVSALQGAAHDQMAYENLNHMPTQIEATVERQFMKTLEGGCTAPIGAKATIKGQSIHFIGGVFALNGQKKAILETKGSLAAFENLGELWGKQVLQQGGKEIMNEILEQLNNE